MGEKLIVVSSDSHAQAPPDIWPEYLEKRYHEFLPSLNEEAEIYAKASWLLSEQIMSPEMLEQHRHDGFRGVYDAGVRLAEMDREGIAAELVYHGDFRATDLMHNVINRKYPLDAVDAGVRAYDRWAYDTFGGAQDRLLLVGGIGPCHDMEATLAELSWIADHGFAATFLPGFAVYPGMHHLADPYWDPFWSVCEELEVPLVVHAGFGWEQGHIFESIEEVFRRVDADGGDDADRISLLATEVFTMDFFADVRPRKPMWQLMLSGVFDRHPELRLVLTEVRADWIPATLRHLDSVYEEHRDRLPAKRKPSEYWQSNCLAGLSFAHKAEVEMRQEIGLGTIAFGRDYPHPEGTWPHTFDWLRDAFRGVPEDELRAMLGGNAIRFLGLNRGSLEEIAQRIGPEVTSITESSSDVDPNLLNNFDLRGGYLKPAEGEDKVALVAGLIQEDLERFELV